MILPSGTSTGHCDRDEADEPPVYSTDQAELPSSSQSCAAGPLLHEGT